MKQIDVFNGDADGIIARHQWRSAHPADRNGVTLITGLKRDISLLARATTSVASEINVFDISFDSNVEAVRRHLNDGANICYFDHHRAISLFEHPRLTAHIDTSTDICTSLIVDRLLRGRYRNWAIAAAFGDNLQDAATDLATSAGLSAVQTQQLRMLGECINYNAYGDTLADLHLHPEILALRIEPYEEPFRFIAQETVFAELQQNLQKDCVLARAVPVLHESERFAIYALPDAAWSRRVSGTFANELAGKNPNLAYAVLTESAGANYAVSIRAPIASPYGADEVAAAFATGGGRKRAAGINCLAENELPKLIAKMDAVWGV